MRHLPAITLTLTLLLVSAAAQTKSVLKTISNNQLTESLSVKAGTTFTIPVGATINNLGTATGFGSGGTWGSITGTLSNQTDLNTALGLKAPLASPTFTGAATAPTVTTTNNLFPTRTLSLLSGTSVYWDNCEGTGYAVALRPITPTANRALYVPNADGTLVSTGDTGTVTNTMLAGSIDLTAKVTGTLPVANGGTGIASLGTGVATALGVSTGTAGAFVVNGGALGTPSSGTLTSCTGLPISTGVSGLGTGVATFLATPTTSNFNTLFGSANWGISTNGSTYSSLYCNGTPVLAGFSSGYVSCLSVWGFGFSVAPHTNAPDAFWFRDAAAVIQQGGDAATPIAQAYKACDGSGTNKGGGNLSLTGGQGTGTGRGGDVIVKTSNTTTTGSTAQSYSTRRYDSAKFVDLTESTATTFCTIGVAASKFAGAILNCTVTANDGTEYQSLTSQVIVDAVAKTTTVTATLSQVNNTTAASSGTLTCTYTAVDSGSNTVLIKANAVSSLTQTVLRIKWSVLSLNSDGADTGAATGSLITPQ